MSVDMGGNLNMIVASNIRSMCPENTAHYITIQNMRTSKEGP